MNTPTSRLLYVSDIRRSIGVGAIEDLFSTVGDVENISVEVLPDSGYSSEFGIFQMSTTQQAMDCAERFHGYRTQNQTLSVASIRPKLMVKETPSKKSKQRR